MPTHAPPSCPLLHWAASGQALVLYRLSPPSQWPSAFPNGRKVTFNSHLKCTGRHIEWQSVFLFGAQKNLPACKERLLIATFPVAPQAAFGTFQEDHPIPQRELSVGGGGGREGEGYLKSGLSSADIKTLLHTHMSSCDPLPDCLACTGKPRTSTDFAPSNVSFHLSDFFLKK